MNTQESFIIVNDHVWGAQARAVVLMKVNAMLPLGNIGKSGTRLSEREPKSLCGFAPRDDPTE